MVRTQGTGIFTEDVAASGSVTASTGIFPFSLTVSGVPVATGTAPPAVVVPSGLVAFGGADDRITAVSGFAYDAFRRQLRLGLGGLPGTTHALHVVGSGIVESHLEVQGRLSAPSGVFTQTLTISGAPVLTGTLTARALSIENPDDAEDMTFFFTNQALKLARMQAVILGTASPSVTWTIRFAANRSAAGTEIVAGGTTTSSLTTGSNVASFTNGTIPAESWVWLETTANAGSVALLTVTLFFDQGG